MEDYIDALLEYLSDRRNDAMSFAFAAASEDAYARQVFLLAREIYR